MKIALPTGGFADLTRTWTGSVHYSLNFRGQTREAMQVVAIVKYLDNEGFFEQEMGKFEPDPQVTELLKEVKI